MMNAERYLWCSLDSVQRDPIYASLIRPDEGYVCVIVDGSSHGQSRRVWIWGTGLKQ